jgi:hypothetical protein
MPAAEKDLLKFNKELYTAAYDAVKPMHDEWERNWRYFLGKQWERQTTIAKGEQVTVNLIFSLVQQSLAHQTTARPTVRRKAFNPEDIEAVNGADFLNKLDPIVWEEQNLTNTFANSMFYAKLCRSAFIQRYYDPFINNAMGGYKVKARDPFTCFPDPSCFSEDIQNDCDFFILAEMKPMAFIRRMWPEKADAIKSHAGESEGDERRAQRYGAESMLAGAPWYKLVDSSTYAYQGKMVSTEFDQKSYVTLFTTFVQTDFLDSEYKFWRKKGVNGVAGFVNETVKTKWRQITHVGNTILYDGPSRFYDGQLPLIHLTTATMPGSLWGVDEFSHLIPLQDLYNDLMSLIGIHTKKMVDPGIAYSTNQITDETKFKKFLSGVRKIFPIKGAANTAIWQDRPQNLGPEAALLLEQIPRMMENIIAQPEILQGLKPAGVKSGEALKALAMNAMPRSNKQTLRFEECVKDTVEKVMLDYLVGQPMVVERMVGQETMRFYPRDYVGLALKTEVIPGSSLPSYADQKIEKIIGVATAIQGMDPMLAQSILKNTDIPELRDLLNQGAGMSPMPQQPGAPGGQQQPPGGAINIPFAV